MTPTVSTPSGTAVVSSETPSGISKNIDNQGNAGQFSGILTLLGGSPERLPVTDEILQPDIGNGQELPPEMPLAGEGGEPLPLLVTVQPAINRFLAKDNQQPFQADVPQSEAVAVVSQIDPAVALVAPVDLTNTTLQSISQSQTAPSTVQTNPSLFGHQLPEQIARLQQLTTHQNLESLPSTTVAPDDIEIPVIPAQAVTTVQEKILKSADIPVELTAVTQSLRRMIAPLSRSESRTGNELASVLVAGQSTTPAQSGVQELTSLTVNTPLQKAGWGQELTDKIQWMVSQRLQGAEIKLNPAHLGPMEIKVQMQNDQATIQFTATHSVVREALESAVPRLREMFENQGVKLGDVDVSEHSFAQQRQEQENNSSDTVAGSRETGSTQRQEDDPVERWTTAVSDPGRLDLFV